MENEVNEPALKYNYVTAKDYLQIERTSPEKHELHEGILITMQGASLKHNRILSRIIVNVGSFLKGKPCEIFPSDLRLKTPGVDTYTYPDAMIVCGKPETIDDTFDMIKNPSVIFEILSPSTEHIDLGKKFFYYVNIPTLKEYVLISSTEVAVKICRKQPDNSWKFEQQNNIEESFTIETIGYNFLLSDLYEDAMS